MSQDYKDTVNLPQTGFPMRADLTTREPERVRRWEGEDLYRRIQEARAGAPLYVLHDGPPFANGDVHMGTALNKVLKDLVIKSRTMSGYRAPYVPGWDCHGLPIEFKVVRESRGLSPLEVRRRCEEYARRYVDIQRDQFRSLGVLADWAHPYLTLDPGYEAEVLRVFAAMVERGLVYRDLKPVYWSTGAQTALAEAEVEYEEKESPSIHVAFPIVAGEGAGEGVEVVIWTTTPWTLPANLAVAVHPRERYVVRPFRRPGDGAAPRRLLLAEKLAEAFVAETGLEVAGPDEATYTGAQLEGWEAAHPFLDRRSRFILGEFVTMETGTGVVHVAPGHGQEDFVAGRKYGLGILSPVDDLGKFTPECGVPELVGKYVFAANPDVIAILETRGALLGQRPYRHSYPHCWRSKTPVVFRAVEQFFIRIDPLRGPALREIDRVRWLPHWGRNRIVGTVESRPDWCISRQRSWGIPLPVFYAPGGEPILDAAVVRRVADLVASRGTNCWFEMADEELAREVGLPEGTTRRFDTLDVWIDSGTSHAAVLRRHPELRWPADLYLEATDQHRGWFQSSLMTSVALEGRAPYDACLTHGFVVDLDGRKISKSGEKPANADHFVGKYGADIVRLWASGVDHTDDVPFSEAAYAQLADTYRRIRNTLRILLGNLHGFDPAAGAAAPREMPLADRWILDRLQEVVAICRRAYDAFEFQRVHHTLNGFCAVELSSLYIDLTKDRLYCDAPGSARRRATQCAMDEIFSVLVRLLAPILAFTAEEAWSYRAPGRSVHLELFPDPDDARRDPAAVARVESLMRWRAMIGHGIEEARKDRRIGKSLEARVTLSVADPEMLAWLEENRAEAAEFFILSDMEVAPGAEDAARVERSPHARCARCWRHVPSVGASAGHPDLCERCEAAIAGRGEG